MTKLFKSYNTDTFGSKMKAIRKELGFTQSNVEEKVGINTETLRSIENGRVIPRYDTIELLSDAYKIDVAKIFMYHRRSHTLYAFYKKLDYLIAYNKKDSLRQVVTLYKEIESNEFNLVSREELNQFKAVIEGVQLINNNEVEKSIAVFCGAIKITNSSFNLESISEFKYSHIEIRLLILIALGFSYQKEYKYANKILLNCYGNIEILTESDYDWKTLYVKVIFNMSYNSHGMDNFVKALEYSTKGINYCIENGMTYSLAAMFYRRGIAKYFLKEDLYMEDLMKSINLLIILDELDLAEVYKSTALKRYGIILKVDFMNKTI